MTDYLRIYMQDQHALGVLWREVARRTARENRQTELGTAARGVADGIAEDVRTFESIMDELGFPHGTVKGLAAAAAERVGRLKPNGHLRGYSPLSRFDELDFLTMGIAGKKQLWANLRDLAGLGERLPHVDFDELIERAQQQIDVLETFRLAAGREVLAGARDVAEVG